MEGEQVINVMSVSKLDLVDRIKVLFGRSIVVRTKLIVPQKEPIMSVNSSSEVTLESSSKHIFGKDRPNFGYSPKD